MKRYTKRNIGSKSTSRVIGTEPKKEKKSAGEPQDGKRVYGIILKGVGGIYSVKGEDGEVYLCSARGVFRHEKIKPLPGDRVVMLVSDKEETSDTSERENQGVIDEILSRKNALIRPPLANIDNIFVVIASAYPDPSTVIADKLITIAEYNKIEPIIVISKSDLDPSSSDRMEAIYRRCGFNVFVTSSERAEGIEQLRAFMRDSCKDAINTFAGVSGAGKSTLMNKLFPSLSLETGAISSRIGRGKNTTRTSELFPMSDLFDDRSDELTGFLADTPGFSMIDFTRFDFYGKEDLPETFREFAPRLTNCRYTKCTHTKEDGCAILEAIERGEIPRERHESYLQIYADIKDKHDWDK